jgi:hypothetical protein
MHMRTISEAATASLPAAASTPLFIVGVTFTAGNLFDFFSPAGDFGRPRFFFRMDRAYEPRIYGAT